MLPSNKPKWIICVAGLIGVMLPGLALEADEGKPSKRRPAPADPSLVTRFYDIHAWTVPVYDFSLDSSAHSAAFVTPANIQSDTFDYRLTGPRYPSRVERTTPAREDRVDLLIKMIEQTVAPETWRDAGGTATIAEIRDILVIRQTRDNQDQIAELLQGLKDHQAETVRTTADWFILPRGGMEKFLKDQNAGHAVVPPPAVDLAALRGAAPAIPHFHAELLCLNGQTVSYVSGRERSLLAYQAVVMSDNNDQFTPFMGTAGAGIALQVCPVVNREGKRATVTFFSTYNDPEKPGAPIPVRSVATTQSSGKPVARTSVTASAHAQNGIVQEFRSTVRLPLDIPVLVGSMTLEPTAKKTEASELVLILSVK